MTVLGREVRNFCLINGGGGGRGRVEGESGGVEGMGVTFEMGEIEEIQYCL